MKIASMIGSMIVTLALVFYSLGYFNERKRRLITKKILLFYTIGITLDVTATVFMIIGSSKGMLTVHGFVGYSSLLGMLTDTLLIWRHYLKEGPGEPVRKPLHHYSSIAYTWWVLAYITGGLLVAVSRM